MSPFMHQATSMSSCPYFFLFRPTSLHVSHFPHFHLATSHRHHVPTRTMKWLVVHTRTLASVLVYSTSHFRVCLFMFGFFLGDFAPHIPPFRRILTPAPTATPRPSNDPSTSDGRPFKRIADLTNTNLHVIPLIIVPHLRDISDITAPWAGHARFSHINYDTGGYRYKQYR